MLFSRKPKTVDTDYTAQSADFRIAFYAAVKNGTPLPAPIFPPCQLVDTMHGTALNAHEQEMHDKNSAMWREEFERRRAIDAKAAGTPAEPALPKAPPPPPPRYRH